MEHKSTLDSHPRRLVVKFGYPMSGSIATDGGDHPQLVHRSGHINLPSRLVRFATHLGLAKQDRRLVDAVKKAYGFITSSYVPGDQVILVVETGSIWEANRHAEATGMLARHLHHGTGPRNPSKTQAASGRHGRQIPIYAVVVMVYSDKELSMSAWSDELKSRLPPGVEHIICWCDCPFRSCSSAFDENGTLISRELRFSAESYSDILVQDIMKHVLYYEKDMGLQWDKHQPVWTHIFDSSSREAGLGDILPSEPTKPAGMYHHELRCYQCLPGLKGGSMLVWKASREGDRLES